MIARQRNYGSKEEIVFLPNKRLRAGEHKRENSSRVTVKIRDALFTTFQIKITFNVTCIIKVTFAKMDSSAGFFRTLEIRTIFKV